MSIGTPVMRDYKGDETPKLRRFALTIGLMLFTYSIAGVQLDSPAKMSPLGVPLIVSRPRLLDVGLLLASLWAVGRFWYYGMVLNVSPLRARRRLRRGILPDGRPDDNINAHAQQFELSTVRYFPSLGRRRVQVGLVADPKTRPSIQSVPVMTRYLLVPLENLDFLAPIWVNVCAWLAYALFVLWGWGRAAEVGGCCYP